MKLSAPKNTNQHKPFYKKRKIRRNIFVLLLVVFLFICGSIASKKIQAKGYNGLVDFVFTISSNYFKSIDAQSETISIEIKDQDFKKLEKNRKQALERGVIINDLDGDYVPAVITYNGSEIKVKLRLKGHMTDHLQDNKWSFRVKTKGNDSFMGMKRFSIQHPGTRGYIYEWIYHELMKREDVIALRYKFIKVSVNGRDWGVYAVEENFENELIENNDRKKGPILRFNPDLYWVKRYNEYTYQNSFDEFASYYSANPEAYRESKVLSDSIQKQYYMQAIAMIEGLRSKKITVAQAFDIPRLAKFHALIDLVGGIHSIDWSDIKYYYNPVTAKFEPVAYESFTNLGSRDISGQYKYTILDSVSNYIDWHRMIFSDSAFFSEYIKQLERVSDPKYLDDFFNDENTELKNNLAILYKEFPYKKFDRALYYKRQEIILKIISPPKALHAYIKEGNDKVVIIQAAAIDALPIHITSVSINGVRSKPCSFILPAKKAQQYASYIDIQFIMPDNFKWNKHSSDSVTIQYSVLGATEKKEANVFPFPHTDSEFIAAELKDKKSTMDAFSFITVNEESKSVLIKPGKYSITENLIIPAGYKLFVNAGVSIDIKNSSKIISYSPVFFSGVDDDQIIIESSDSSSRGIEIINAGGSIFRNVVFKNLPKIHDEQWARSGAITFYESPVAFYNCSFYQSKAEDAVNLIRSDFLFKECLFKKMHDDALDIDFSEGTIANCVFEQCRENALDITMGKVRVSAVYINGAGNKAMNIKAGTQLTGDDIRIKNAGIAISAEDQSMVDIKNSKIEDSEIGLVAYKNKPGAGHPKIIASRLVFSGVKKNYLKEAKSSIIVDGNEMSDDVKDVENIIKGDKKKHK
jgi:hypothetical protein